MPLPPLFLLLWLACFSVGGSHGVGVQAAAREVAQEEEEEEGRQSDGHHEGPEEEVEERPCVRGVCNMVLHRDTLHRAQTKVSEDDEDDEGHGHGHEHESAPRAWWQPFEREYYYVPLESWRLHVLTIAIFGLPTAAVLLYIHSRPDLSRTLCLV